MGLWCWLYHIGEMGADDIKRLSQEISEVKEEFTKIRLEQNDDGRQFDDLRKRIDGIEKNTQEMADNYQKAVMYLDIISGSLKWAKKAIIFILSGFILWKESKNIWQFLKDLIK